MMPMPEPTTLSGDPRTPVGGSAVVKAVPVPLGPPVSPWPATGSRIITPALLASYQPTVDPWAPAGGSLGAAPVRPMSAPPTPGTSSPSAALVPDQSLVAPPPLPPACTSGTCDLFLGSEGPLGTST